MEFFVMLDLNNPKWTEVNHDNIPPELKRRPNWCIWTPTIKDNGSIAKIPIDPNTMQRAKINRPDTWGTYADAVAAIAREAAKGKRYGLEYMFSGRDDLFFIDLDKCFSPSRMLKPHAAKILDMLKPTYIEDSMSGEGLHIIGFGFMPTDRLITPSDLNYKVEIYKRQPLAITGKVYGGMKSITDNHDELTRILWAYFPKKMMNPTEGGTKGDEDEAPRKPVKPAAPAPEIDEEKIIRWITSNPERRAVWNGDNSRYNNDASAADMACMNWIVIALKDDATPENADRIFRKSGRVRPKWDAKHYRDGMTYGEHTIQVALYGKRVTK